MSIELTVRAESVEDLHQQLARLLGPVGVAVSAAVVPTVTPEAFASGVAQARKEEPPPPAQESAQATQDEQPKRRGGRPPKAAQEAAKPAEGAAKPADDDEDPINGKAAPITIEVIRAKLQEYNQHVAKGETPLVVKMLVEVTGARRASDVPPEKYPALAQHIDNAVAAAAVTQ